MDSLPEELINVIMLYTRKDCIKMSMVCKQYNKIYLFLIENIKNGKLSPELWLDTIDYKVGEYNRTIYDEFVGDKEQTYFWEVNGRRTDHRLKIFYRDDIITDQDIQLLKKMILTVPDQVFFNIDINDGCDYYILLSKHLGVHYCVFVTRITTPMYNDTTLVNHGIFSYSEKWEYLWNMCLDQYTRNEILEFCGFIKPDLYDFYHKQK